MQILENEYLNSILACPACGGALMPGEDSLTCAGCAQQYPVMDSGQLDLRLRQAKEHPITFALGRDLLEGAAVRFEPLPPNSNPEIETGAISVPWHLTENLISYFPRAKAENACMLDLGCGAAVHQQIGEHCGFQWVGLDYSHPQAPLLGDGHALPFVDQSFEFVLSIAVLEHLQYPFVVMDEVRRVLQPGGTFIGTVSFLEPLHEDSFYHHTHLGTYNMLRSAGFEVSYVSPSARWTGLKAQANMALFRKLPEMLSTALVLPIDLLHRLWWKLGYALTKEEKASERYRQLSTTGAFSFIAHKP